MMFVKCQIYSFNTQARKSIYYMTRFVWERHDRECMGKFVAIYSAIKKSNPKTK